MMNTAELAEQFVTMCRQGKNFDVMQQLYADNIVSVEAIRRSTGSFETAGKGAVIQKSAEWAGAHEIHGGSVDGPFLLGDRFAVVFTFDVTPKATGKRVSAREVAIYSVENGRITREEFFYGDGSETLAR
jgi:ketosteroid isomerase-like protein